MTENERVKFLRKEKLKLTLDKFSKRVGISISALSDVEHSRNSLSSQLCRSICREFGIREEWLRDGEEPMYKPKEKTPYELFAEESGLGEEFGKVFEEYAKLPMNVRREIIRLGVTICETYLKELRKNGMLSKEEPEPEEKPAATVEERDQWGCTAEDYHRVQSIEDEMKLEKEKREKSGA